MKAHIPHLPLLALLVVALGQPTIAAPLVSVGDNVDIFFNGSTSLQWSSNVFRDEDDEREDFIWTLTPGFEVNFGRGVSNADFSVITRYEVRRYFDLDVLDAELFSIQAIGSYRTSRLDLSGSAFYREMKRSSGDINLRMEQIESDVYGGRFDAEYRFSPKFSFGTGLSYEQTEFRNPFDFLFADREQFTIPLDIFYELTPKVDLSVGYTYGESDVDDTPFTPGDTSFTTESHFFNVGARGNLLPKLTGFFKIGYRVYDDDRAGSSSNSTLGLDSDLTWAVSPKLTTSLGLSRQYGTSGEGHSSINTSVRLTGNYSINNYYAASAFANYTLRKYIGIIDDEDKQYSLGARLTYTPNQYWRFGAGYTYTENDSERRSVLGLSSSYEDHTVDVSATLRY